MKKTDATNANQKGIPILEASTWEQLLQAISPTLPDTMFRKIPYHHHRRILAAAAALARLIATFAPELIEKPRLSILIPGAQINESFDEGIWTATFAPRFMGRDIDITLHLVGTKLNPIATGAVEGILGQTRKNHLHNQDLQNYLRKNPHGNHDAIVMFNPRFHLQPDWLDDGSLRQLLSMGVPILGSSLGAQDFGCDRVMLQAHGYAMKDNGCENPFNYPTPEASTQTSLWASILWRLAHKIPANDYKPDTTKLQCLRMAMIDSMLTRPDQPNGPGHTIQVPTPQGTMKCLVLLDNLVLAPANKIAIFTDGTLEQTDISIAHDSVPQHPGEDATPIEKAVWAAEARKAASTKDNLIEGNTPAICRQETFKEESTSDPQGSNHSPTAFAISRAIKTAQKTHKCQSQSDYLTVKEAMKMLDTTLNEDSQAEGPVYIAFSDTAAPVIQYGISDTGLPVLHTASDEAMKHTGVKVEAIGLTEVMMFVAGYVMKTGTTSLTSPIIATYSKKPGRTLSDGYTLEINQATYIKPELLHITEKGGRQIFCLTASKRKATGRI